MAESGTIADLGWEYIRSMPGSGVGELRIHGAIGNHDNLRIIFYVADVTLSDDPLPKIWILSVIQKKSMDFTTNNIRTFKARLGILKMPYLWHPLGRSKIMESSTLLSSVIATQIQSYLHIQNALNQCDTEIRLIIADMIEIFESDDATDEEKKAAIYTIQDALFPGLAEDFCEQERRNLETPKAIAIEKQFDEEEATFADRHGKAMAVAQITQEMLAEKTGVSQPAISLMLSRQSRPQMRTIGKFAEALGIQPADLWPS